MTLPYPPSRMRPGTAPGSTTARRHRGTAAVTLACALLFGAAAAHAQGRGPGGPGGGMPGGPGGPGGMMGGGRMGFVSRGPSPSIERSPTRVSPQLGLPGRWWDDGKTARIVGLRSTQQRRMDEIFEANKGTLLGLLTTLQREEARLISLPPGDLQDEAKVFAAIDRVSQARADLEKANAHLMLQIRQQMDSNQIAALDHQIASGH